MANRNGLLASRDVAATGAVASNFFVRKGDPLSGVSPLTLVSPDGSESATIVLTNAGELGVLPPVGGAVVLGGEAIELANTSSAPQITIGEDAGRVYDTVYNKPLTITTLAPTTGGNIVYNVVSSLAAGTYQLQLSAETPVAGSQSLSFFATDPPDTQVINFSGVEILPATVGTNLLQAASGYFVHAGGDLRVQITTAGTAWTAVWNFQIVRIN